MSVQHDASDRCDCDGCRPSHVLDGQELVENFKRLHKIKSDELAKALMAIESFRPVPR